MEGSRAAAKAVEGFIRKNIEAYFGCWASTYTLFSLDPRLVSCRSRSQSATAKHSGERCLFLSERGLTSLFMEDEPDGCWDTFFSSSSFSRRRWRLFAHHARDIFPPSRSLGM